jgi:hypothetical protein
MALMSRRFALRKGIRINMKKGAPQIMECPFSYINHIIKTLNLKITVQRYFFKRGFPLLPKPQF